MRERRTLLAVVAVLVLLTGMARAQDEVRGLPRWFLGFHFASGARSSYDVFSRAGTPPAAVKDPGGGGSGQFGYRIGDRFLLGLQIVVVTHDVDQAETRLHDGEALITGTVLFREQSALQPFLRAGLGGTVLVVEEPAAHTMSLGFAANGGVGVQWRLVRNLAIEAEAAALFGNYVSGRYAPREGDAPDENWGLMRSNVGYRVGVGMVFWF